MEVVVTRPVVPAAITSVTIDEPEPEPGQPVRFVVSVTGTDPVNVEWDFGDGTTSDQKITQHAYEEAGEYDVVVRVENIQVAGDDAVDTRRMSVNVVEPEPDIPLLAPVHFDLNSSYFHDDGRAILEANINVLREHPDLCVHIRGYTDDTGDPEYNQWLSDRRAERVKNFYIENGIPADRIHAEGLGVAPEPCPDGTPMCQQNRRADSILVECW